MADAEAVGSAPRGRSPSERPLLGGAVKPPDGQSPLREASAALREILELETKLADEELRAAGLGAGLGREGCWRAATVGVTPFSPEPSFKSAFGLP